MALTFQGVGSPFTVNLQNLDRQALTGIQNQLSKTEADLRKGLAGFQGDLANTLAQFDRDIAIGGNLLRSLSRENTLNEQGQQFDIGNLQDNFLNLQKQTQLNFKAAMQGFRFDMAELRLGYQGDLANLEYSFAEKILGYDEELAVYTERLKNAIEEANIKDAGSIGQLQAMIRGAEVMRAAQLKILASLARTEGYVQNIGDLNVAQADLQKQIALIQQNFLRSQRRTTTFKYQQSRGIRQAVAQAQAGFAESPLAEAIGEQALGVELEKETAGIMGAIEQTKSRRDIAIAEKKKAKETVKAQVEGISRQKIGARAQYDKLGFDIEGYKARIASIRRAMSSRGRSLSKVLQIRKDFTQKKRDLAAAHLAGSKSRLAKAFNLKRARIKYGKSLERKNFILIKDKNQIEQNKKFHDTHRTYMNNKIDIGQNQFKTSWERDFNSYRRLHESRVGEAKIRAQKEAISKIEDQKKQVEKALLGA